MMGESLGATVQKESMLWVRKIIEAASLWGSILDFGIQKRAKLIFK